MRTALLHLSVLAAITISVHSTAIIATTGTAATVGIGLTAVTAGTLANVGRCRVAGAVATLFKYLRLP